MKARQDDDAPVIEHDDEGREVSEVEVSEVDDLREQIAETRAELGETVEALAAKADVKAQVKEKVAEGKEQLKEKQELVMAKVAEVRESVSAATPDQAREVATTLQASVKARPAPVMVAGGLLLGLLLWRRRSR